MIAREIGPILVSHFRQVIARNAAAHKTEAVKLDIAGLPAGEVSHSFSLAKGNIRMEIVAR